MSDFTVGPFFITLGFYLFWILIVLIIWNFLWLSPYPLTLPDPINSIKTKKISNIVQATRCLYDLLFKNLKDGVFLQQCGFEAFSYVFFLKRVFLMILLFFLLSFLFGVPFSLISSHRDILSSFDLENDLYKLYFQMLFLILFTLIFYQNLLSFKTSLAETWKTHKNRSPDLYKLQEKTLRFKGFSKNQSLQTFLQKIRESLPLSEKDAEIHAVLVPNTLNLLELEAKKQGILLRKSHVILAEKDYAELQEIEQNIEIIKQRGFISSGNAVLCVSSQRSFEFLLQRFTILRVPFWRTACLKAKVWCSKCCLCECCCDATAIHQSLLNKEEHEGMLAYALPSPEDISWRNFNNDDLLSSVKRVAFNIFAILFMVFFTTPASLITVLGLTEIIRAIIKSDTPEPGSFSNLLEKNLSPLLIFLINQLLLYMINKLAVMKRHTRISKTQMTIFNTCCVYMLFNSFIIPTLSMTTAESIFSFFSEQSSRVDVLLETFYLKNTGSLFVILLIQSGTFSFTANILAVADLVLNYFNRKMMIIWREHRLTQENWLKDETENFAYGVNYATIVIFLIIVLVYSTTVPAICIAGLFFSFFKLFADSWEIFTGHRKEMESNGQIITKVLWFCSLGGLFFELLMVVYYSVAKLVYNVIIMLFVMVFSVVMTWRIERVSIQKISEENLMISEENLKIWERNYRHPFVFDDFANIKSPIDEKL